MKLRKGVISFRWRPPQQRNACPSLGAPDTERTAPPPVRARGAVPPCKGLNICAFDQTGPSENASTNRSGKRKWSVMNFCASCAVADAWGACENKSRDRGASSPMKKSGRSSGDKFSVWPHDHFWKGFKSNSSTLCCWQYIYLQRDARMVK